MNDYFTKRGIAKFATRMIVSSAASSAAMKTYTTVTDTDPDEAPEAAEISATVVGMFVAMKLKPQTDKMVDAIADWHINRKAEVASDITE